MASKETRHTGSEVLYPADAAVAAPGQEQPAGGKGREFDPAFALRDELEQSGAGQTGELYQEEGRGLRSKMTVGAVLFAVLFVSSLFVSTTLGAGISNPAGVLDGIIAHVTMPLDALFGGAAELSKNQILELHPYYYQVESRFTMSLVTALCGVMLALAGSLYQMVFKNPIAAPTMLGVSNGIQLGLLVFVLQFQAAALNMEAMRYAYAYVGSAVVLLLVLGLTKAICGRGRTFSVFELLMVGSIFSQVAGSVVQVVTDSVMTDELWEVYQQVSEASNYVVSTPAFIALGVVALCTVVPVFLMRYSINAISFSDLEARLIGVDSTVLKVACLVLGTVMVTIAQINLGTVSMVSLVVPFVSRAWFGTEFKHQFWGDLIIGAVLLLLCSDLILMFPFFNMELNLGTVVSFVALPFYVWIIASRQRGWK